MTDDNRTVFLGFGYCAKALVRELEGSGAKFGAVVRARRSDDEDRYPQVRFVDWNGASDDTRSLVGTATNIVSSVPPADDGDAAMDLLEQCLPDNPESLRWLALLGTTGPYGDRGGAWVDETAEISPDHVRASLRAQQEQAWLEAGSRLGWPVHIFRLSGIYGPGRSAIDRVRSGKARRIVKKDQVFSRIHVEDIAQVLAASMKRPNPGEIYNVADDRPAPPQDVIEYAACLLGLPVPPDEPFDTAKMTPMARSFYEDNRRVSNRKIREELGVELRYPDYEAGLNAILAAEASRTPSRQ
jgi:nucleoside-diphosphate-sugar epimerase